MDEKMKVPPYVIKQIIAGELYERKNSFLNKVKEEQNKVTYAKQMNFNHIEEWLSNANNTAQLADEIRMGRITLEQSLSELTLDEKRVVYDKCKKWYQENKQKEIEK